ncbi:MAG: hypothetical protein D3921_08450 [Candidatus Electrothrix sp. AW1]|nr:hypothetical protein [Candidatus Electrothrix gigas]
MECRFLGAEAAPRRYGWAKSIPKSRRHPSWNRHVKLFRCKTFDGQKSTLYSTVDPAQNISSGIMTCIYCAQDRAGE